MGAVTGAAEVNEGERLKERGMRAEEKTTNIAHLVSTEHPAATFTDQS